MEFQEREREQQKLVRLQQSEQEEMQYRGVSRDDRGGGGGVDPMRRSSPSLRHAMASGEGRRFVSL